MKLQFEADKCTISERASDNSYIVKFETGETQQIQIAKMILIPKMTPLTITVEYADE